MTDDAEEQKTRADETDLQTRKAWSTPRLTNNLTEEAEAGPPGVVDGGYFS